MNFEFAVCRDDEVLRIVKMTETQGRCVYAFDFKTGFLLDDQMERDDRCGRVDDLFLLKTETTRER